MLSSPDSEFYINNNTSYSHYGLSVNRLYEAHTNSDYLNFVQWFLYETYDKLNVNGTAYIDGNLYIDGNVGIGTNNPQTILNIVKAGDPRLRIAGMDFNDTAGIQLLENNNSPQFGAELVYNGDNDKFYINMIYNTPSTALTILGSNRNVGIGTDNPSEILEVDGNIKCKGRIFQDYQKKLSKVNT